MNKFLTNRSTFLLWLTASWVTTAEADIDLWQIGGSGLEWAEHDSVAILIDETTTPGAIQPVYIQPDRSVFSYLTNWGDWTPRELGYVDGERPRVSGNLRLVDGDSTSYLAPSSGASPDGRTFTFDVAVPVPIFAFGFYTPSQGYRSDGNSLREDVVPAYELYIAAHNPNEWRQIADVQENFPSRRAAPVSPPVRALRPLYPPALALARSRADRGIANILTGSLGQGPSLSRHHRRFRALR